MESRSVFWCLSKTGVYQLLADTSWGKGMVGCWTLAYHKAIWSWKWWYNIFNHSLYLPQRVPQFLIHLLYMFQLKGLSESSDCRKAKWHNCSPGWVTQLASSPPYNYFPLPMYLVTDAKQAWNRQWWKSSSQPPIPTPTGRGQIFWPI